MKSHIVLVILIKCTRHLVPNALDYQCFNVLSQKILQLYQTYHNLKNNICKTDASKDVQNNTSKVHACWLQCTFNCKRKILYLNIFNMNVMTQKTWLFLSYLKNVYIHVTFIYSYFMHKTVDYKSLKIHIPKIKSCFKIQTRPFVNCIAWSHKHQYIREHVMHINTTPYWPPLTDITHNAKYYNIILVQ